MKRLDREDGAEDVFDQMQNFIDHFQNFGKDMASTFTGAVPVDIIEENGHITIRADLPGVEKEEVNVKADEEKIQIMAESAQEVKEENEKYYRKERRSRTFQRTVPWPKSIDAESIEAKYKDGVLTVTAEVAEEEGRNIRIK